tara:strand:- start:1523 stop:2146 length:624 start_codon:yes stop_codon:yes gene_type:complete
MTIATYAELQSTIALFINRDDSAAIIPTWISMAEDNMNRAVRHWRQEKRSSANLNSRYNEVPDDFLQIIRFGITSNKTSSLDLISQGEILDRRSKSANVSGLPLFYALTAGEIELFPTPAEAYPTELYYYSKIDRLSDTNTSNWLLSNFQDAYLYGSLIHSAPYLGDDGRLPVWAALHQSAIDAINVESEAVKSGGSGRRLKIRGLS